MFVRTENGWNHRPRFKVLINPILRKLQWFTKRPFVIVSYCDMKHEVPKLIRYGIARMSY